MPIGPLVRQMFGPYEHTVAETYRRIFVDLDDFARLIESWAPTAQKILEVGCGEGAMTERLVRAFPVATITAIDITPNVGRLYRGPRSNVKFSQETVEELARREPGYFDLVVLADVMHHVPFDVRPSLTAAIAQALTPNGSLIFKDWIISSSPIHFLCEASDRYLTGDHVSYFTIQGINDLAEKFGQRGIRQTAYVKPWRNNVAVLIQS